MTEQIDPKLHRQLELEIEMQGLGADRYWSTTEAAMENGRASETLPGTYLLKRVIEPYAEAIAQFIVTANSGRPGPRQRAAVFLEPLDPKVVAFVASRWIVNGCVRGRRSMDNGSEPLHALAPKVARAVEDEARLDAFSKQNAGLLKFMEGKLDSEGATSRHKRTVLFYTMGKAGLDWDNWTPTDCIHVGMKLLELFEQSTGLVNIRYGLGEVKSKGLRKTVWTVELTKETSEWFDHQLSRCALTKPFRLPTLIPPKKWNWLDDGGYFSNNIRHPLVINVSKPHRELLKDAHLSQVRGGVNALQNTAWAINLPVQTVAKTYAESGVEVGELAVLEDLPLPEKPEDIAHNKESLQHWKSEAKRVHVENQKRYHERVRHSAVLGIADRFSKEREFYFPHRLCFRGRAYPIPVGLQPQGSDVVKSLLQFAKPMRLGSEEAVRWLAIQGANVWGEDKVSLDDRVQWVKDHEHMIVAAAEDPYSNRWWTETTKSWSFLAFCFEWAGYKRDGLDHLSSIPIAMDGSCNGLQHFSAMLRDPVGGRAVNLVPSDEPEDIYQRVADRTTERLKEMVEKGEEKERLWAETWLSMGIDRTITKRPVMVLPYGGTFRSCMQYVKEATTKVFDQRGGYNPFAEEYPKAVGLLAKLVWASIGDVVIAARSVMDWLQQVARIVTKQDQFIHWTTPTGFVVCQNYKNLKNRMVKTKFNGGLVYLPTAEETDTLNKSKQASAISPNFVHSMDAAAMFMTINRLLDRGVTSFAMIHDSYGTHAANADLMARTIRETFVEMYSGDILNDFREQVMAQLPPEVAETVPKVPDQGTLDLKQVLESDFFFA